MSSLREQSLTGLAHLAAVTALLQRIRRTHPTAGLWEAADRQWSWRTPRSSDDLPQLFWFDDEGEPAAAVITTSFAQGVGFDPIVMPDTPPDQVAHIVDRGLAHAAKRPHVVASALVRAVTIVTLVRVFVDYYRFLSRRSVASSSVAGWELLIELSDPPEGQQTWRYPHEIAYWNRRRDHHRKFRRLVRRCPGNGSRERCDAGRGANRRHTVYDPARRL